MYPPHSRVGAWLSTHECAIGLVARGHQVEVTTHYPTPRPYMLDGIHVVPEDQSTIGHADVIVSHLGDDQWAHRFALERGVPSVRMVHGTVNNPHDRLNGTRLAIFNSQAMRNEIRWDGPSVVIPPIINPDEYRTTPGDRTTLVNLSAAKGGQTFWLCAALLRDHLFLGVKGGYGRQFIHSTPNVEVIHPTANMRDDVYARTRILLMPSERETYGRTAIEAACSGIPTLAHPTPGLQEALGDHAIWIDRDDIKRWAATIETLDDPEQWADASQQALTLARTLEPERHRSRFVDQIEKVAA